MEYAEVVQQDVEYVPARGNKLINIAQGSFGKNIINPNMSVLTQAHNINKGSVLKKADESTIYQKRTVMPSTHLHEKLLKDAMKNSIQHKILTHDQRNHGLERPFSWHQITTFVVMGIKIFFHTAIIIQVSVEAKYRVNSEYHGALNSLAIICLISDFIVLALGLATTWSDPTDPTIWEQRLSRMSSSVPFYDYYYSYYCHKCNAHVL